MIPAFEEDIQMGRVMSVVRKFRHLSTHACLVAGNPILDTCTDLTFVTLNITELHDIRNIAIIQTLF